MPLEQDQSRRRKLFLDHHALRVETFAILTCPLISENRNIELNPVVAAMPGQGLSSSTVNVLWGMFNLAVAYGLIARVGRFELRQTRHIASAKYRSLAKPTRAQEALHHRSTKATSSTRCRMVTPGRNSPPRCPALSGLDSGHAAWGHSVAWCRAHRAPCSRCRSASSSHWAIFSSFLP